MRSNFCKQNEFLIRQFLTIHLILFLLESVFVILFPLQEDKEEEEE